MLIKNVTTRRLFLLAICSLVSSTTLFGQNLLEERIRKISKGKRSIYLNSGIFHNGQVKHKGVLAKVRHHYKKGESLERIVLDFEGSEVPRIYGNISSQKKVIYLTLFDTKLLRGAGSFGHSKFVKEIKFFPIKGEPLAIEIFLKEDVSVEPFYLERKGRLVLDLKR